MTIQRVTVLPGTGVEGIIYIVEPGNASYIWTGSAYRNVENRPTSIEYPRKLGDNP